jgi:hypothetical protein
MTASSSNFYSSQSLRLNVKNLHFELQRWFWEIKPSVTNQKLNIKGEEYAEE